MWGKLKQFITWKIAGPKIEKFIDLNMHTLLEEFPDLEYVEFVFKGKKFRYSHEVAAKVVAIN